MKKILLIFSCLLALFVANANTKTYPKISVDGKEYYLYTVQKSEGYYAISQRFGVPQTMIIEANPNTARPAEHGSGIGTKASSASKYEAGLSGRPESTTPFFNACAA